MSHFPTEKPTASPATVDPTLELYKRAFEECHEAIGIIDSDGCYLMQNRAHEELLGYSDAQLVGKSPSIHIGEEVFQRVAAELAECGTFVRELNSRRSDGEEIPIELSAYTVSMGNGQPPYFVGIKRDLRDRRQIERHQAMQSIYATLDRLPDYGVILVDGDGRVQQANSGAQRILGPPNPEMRPQEWPQTLGMFQPDTSTPIPEDRFPLVLALAGATVGSRDVFVQNEFVPESVSIRLSARPIRNHENAIIGAVMLFHDVSKVLESERRRRELEIELRQIQKMESIGQLAAGIAHDFNNLLTPILGYTEAVSSGLEHGSEDRKSLERSIFAAERARELVQQLLAFGRKQVLQLRPLDLNAEIRRAYGVLRRVVAENIEIGLELSELAPVIRADPTQIDQILLNLIANAADAMNDGGLVRVSTSTLTLSEDERRAAGIPSGRSFVALTVRDSGCGIDPGTMERIFEPFYSTKERGHGTGLGLSTVYGIVKQHGGGIRVESSGGQGALVELLFPRVESASIDEPVPVTPVLSDGPETILVVEDDESVRSLVCDLLRQRGYEVMAASHSGEAMSLVHGCKHPIHLLLTDVVMPGGDGVALYEQLQQEHTETRVLFMSGYASETLAKRGRLDPRTRILEKPFRASHLLEKVRDALDDIGK